MNVEVEAVVEAVVRELKDRMMVEVEASGRHVHLCREDVERLFDQIAAGVSGPMQFYEELIIGEASAMMML